MNKISLIIILIISACILFVSGGGIGVFLKAQEDNSKINKLSSIVDSVTSKIVVGVSVLGEVTKIEGRNVTLSSDNESIIVDIEDYAIMYSLVSKNGSNDLAGGLTKKSIKFDDIKVGDYLNINTVVSRDGIMKANIVVIPPSFVTNNTDNTSSTK